MPPKLDILDISDADLEALYARMSAIKPDPTPMSPGGSTTIADAVARSANATAASADAVGAVVAATAIKVMTFWTKEPEQWFQNLEGQFEINGIKVDSTKYYYVIQNLPQDIVCEVKSLTKNPPAVGKYPAIKALLLRLYGRKKIDLVKELLQIRSLGGRTCAAHLAYMRGLVTDYDAKSDIFRAIFLFCIPLHIRRPLLHSEKGLDDIATIADGELFADNTGDLHPGAGVAQLAARSDQVEGHLPQLAIDYLPAVDRVQVNRGQQQHQRQSANRTPLGAAPRPQRAAGTPGIGARTNSVCRNHLLFGAETWECQRPSSCLLKHLIAPRPLNQGAGRQ